MLLSSKSASLLVILFTVELLHSLGATPTGLPKSRSNPVLDTENLQYFADVAKYGLPVLRDEDEQDIDGLKVCKNYIYSYDQKWKDPIWVMEYMTNETVRNRIYMNDLSPESGHTVNRLIMDPAICASKVFPQLPALSRGPWMSLEKYVEALALRSENIRVITGSYYSTKGSSERLMSGIRMTGPSMFYKVIVSKDSDGKFALETFLMPYSEDNDGRSSLTGFRYELEDLERKTGMKFFRKLDRKKIKQRTMQFNLAEKLDAWEDYILEPTVSQHDYKAVPANGQGKKSGYTASSSGRSSSSRRSLELTSDDESPYSSDSTKPESSKNKGRSSPLHDIIKKLNRSLSTKKL